MPVEHANDNSKVLWKTGVMAGVPTSRTLLHPPVSIVYRDA